MQNLTVDSHQHFWQLSRGDYGWLTSDLPSLFHDFLPEDLAPILKKNKIDATVVVQAAPTLEETRFLLNLADNYDFIAGVVGWVDMQSATAIGDLASLSESVSFKGIRPMIQDIEDPRWMLNPELHPSFEFLAKNQKCFDLLIKPIHLKFVPELLERYPTLRAVIDHCAKPAIASKEYDEWAVAMEAIASGSSAYCKLSGLLSEASGKHSYAEIEPYTTHVLNCFGDDRVMWGSDWPVLNLASNYDNWRSMIDVATASMSTTSNEKIMGKNAIDFYRLSI